MLLVVLDTARADRFTPHGGPSSIAPAVDDLARRGTAVRRAVATSNWTLPSHVSLLTGLLPSELGVAGGAGDRAAYLRTVREGLARHASRTLAAVLLERGYDTRGVSTNPWIRAEHGFDTGFEVFADVEDARPRFDSLRRTRRSWWRARHDDGAAEARAHLRRWTNEANRPCHR